MKVEAGGRITSIRLQEDPTKVPTEAHDYYEIIIRVPSRFWTGESFHSNKKVMEKFHLGNAFLLQQEEEK